MSNAPSPTHRLLDDALALFLARFDVFVAASGRKPSGVSADLFGSNRKVSALRDPASDTSVKLDVLAEADRKLAALAAEAGITLPDAVESAESETAAVRPLQAGAA